MRKFLQGENSSDAYPGFNPEYRYSDDQEEEEEEEESPLNSANEDENLDDQVNKYLSKYFNTAQKGSRKSKSRTSWRHQSADAEISERRNSSSCQSPITEENNPSSDDEDSEIPDRIVPSDLKVKKRDISKRRSIERDMKRDYGGSREIMDYGAESPENGVQYSLPIQPPPKVDTPNRYLSLNSLPVSMRDPSKSQSGTHTKHIRNQECPPDRLQFFKLFSILVQIGNNDSQRDEKNLNRQRSHEEQVWQNQVNDLLWLELQAWHEGSTPEETDKELCKRREHVEETLQNILQFRYNYLDDISHTDNFDINFSPESTNCSVRLCQVTCQHYLSNQNAALEQVYDLLEKLEEAEKLYPSPRSMGRDHSTYISKEFRNHFKSMNLWWNITKDLQQKIHILGTVLSSYGVTSPTWPKFSSENGPIGRSSPNLKLSPLPEKGCRVSFKVIDLNLSQNSDNTDGEGESDRPPSRSETPVLNNFLNIRGKGLLRSFSDLSLDESSCPSPYRRYVDKLLKQRGLRKILQSLQDFLSVSLQKAQHALQKPTPQNGMPFKRPNADSPSPTCAHASLSFSRPNIEHAAELTKHGVWSETYKAINLPPFQPLYLFLLRMPLDVVHECLCLRLEQQPGEPSHLSIRQLMRECKEVIKASMLVRYEYVQMVKVALNKQELENLEQELETFDEDVKKMFEVYLKYLQSFILMLPKFTQVKHHTQTQKSFLEEEWTFVKTYCSNIRSGVALAGNMFCSMASHALQAIGDSLETGIDKHISTLQDISAHEQPVTYNVRLSILTSCREFKAVFQRARERAVKGIALAKMLRKDLEIAAQFTIGSSMDELLKKLKETNHIRVIAPHSSNLLMFIPENIKDNSVFVWQLINITCGHEYGIDHSELDQDGYVALLRCDSCAANPDQWKGPTLTMEPTAETTISLSHVEVNGLLLVVRHSSHLGAQRKAFLELMGNTISLHKEHTSCNTAIAESLKDLKEESLSLREKISSGILIVEKNLNMNCFGDLQDIDLDSLQKHCREVLHQCYKFGFEYHKEVTRLVTGELRVRLGIGLLSFAKQWMQFVAQWCERGRGLRPRWSHQGLEFLIIACDPHNLKILSEEEFTELKQYINDCITHVIGSADKTTPPPPVSCPQSPIPKQRKIRSGRSWQYENNTPLLNRTVSSVSSRSETSPSSPLSWISRTSSQEDLNDKLKLGFDLTDTSECTSPVTPIEKVQKTIKQLEQQMQQSLQDKNVIGRITEVKVKERNSIKYKKVHFRWQRGFKVGGGRFGKVYTAINNDTGELVAIKEIPLQPNDHKTIKDVVDELRIFEGIQHKYLIRYYGIEIHREEMLIFMEYCTDGTLESLSQQNLPESLIRKYTRQLLEAVNVLHENKIVHRDIKGANIFLTSDGNLKLGDFGCCMKLRNHTTMAGEMNTLVGTPAYMAPEIFTKPTSEGHGRAADIWSVGCVVVEMVTGKHPWPELEGDYQIMFKVGMGGIPAVPDTVNEECKDFLSHCFQHDPKLRWTASQLLDHPFTKVDTDEDYQSIPYLRERPRLPISFQYSNA